MPLSESLVRALSPLAPVPEDALLTRSAAELEKLGFTGPNTLACVAVCRDELCQPLVAKIHTQWGEAFNLASLGGLFFAGTTGLHAALHHAPNEDGAARLAFFAFVHIAIDEQGEFGRVQRPGRAAPTRACGALAAFHDEVVRGAREFKLDHQDPEQSLLKQRLARELPVGDTPSFWALTRRAQRAAEADLEAAIVWALPPECDFALLSGVQLHTPDGGYLAPVAAYARVTGQRVVLSLGPSGHEPGPG